MFFFEVNTTFLKKSIKNKYLINLLSNEENSFPFGLEEEVLSLSLVKFRSKRVKAKVKINPKKFS